MGGFTETVGVTVYQSVLTAVGSFRFLRWMASLSIKVSYTFCRRQFSVPEMGGFTETVGVTAYQSVLTAVGSFRFLRWVASLRQLASLPIKVS